MNKVIKDTLKTYHKAQRDRKVYLGNVIQAIEGSNPCSLSISTTGHVYVQVDNRNDLFILRESLINYGFVATWAVAGEYEDTEYKNPWKVKISLKE